MLSNRVGPFAWVIILTLAFLGWLHSFGMVGFAHGETLPPEVRIGVPASVAPDGQQRHGSTLGPATVAAIEAEFAATGTKVSWVYFVNAGPGINEALAANQIDFAFYGDFPAVIARSGGIGIKLLVPGSRGSTDVYLVVPEDSPATSIADLKGKRLSVNMGRPWMLTLSRLLKANGLTMADFQIYNLVMPDGDAAVAAHSVDGQVTIDGLQLEERHLAKIIWSSRDAPLDWRFTAELFGQEAFISQYPDATRRLVRGYLAGTHYYALPEHRDEYLHNLSEALHVPLPALVKAWSGRDVKTAVTPLFDPFITQHYRDVIGYAVENKLIRRGIPVEPFFEPRFLDEALKSLGLDDFWQPLDEGGNPLTVAAAK